MVMAVASLWRSICPESWKLSWEVAISGIIGRALFCCSLQRARSLKVASTVDTQSEGASCDGKSPVVLRKRKKSNLPPRTIGVVWFSSLF
jgi:hypothetical protein